MISIPIAPPKRSPGANMSSHGVYAAPQVAVGVGVGVGDVQEDTLM